MGNVLFFFSTAHLVPGFVKVCLVLNSSSVKLKKDDAVIQALLKAMIYSLKLKFLLCIFGMGIREEGWKGMSFLNGYFSVYRITK